MLTGRTTTRLVRPIISSTSTTATATATQSCAAISTSTSTLADLRAPTDYFHDSLIPTFQFQASLPRLPVPKLDDTLDGYLSFVQPLVSDVVMADTRKAVEDFRVGAGPGLQESLERRDAAHPETSYIADIWSDMYLANRDSFPLNLTPQLTWKDDPVPEKMDQVSRATDFVAAAVRFQRSVEKEVLAPDVFFMGPKPHPAAEWAIANIVPEAFAYYPMYFMKGFALDMHQYKNLFYSTRIPLVGKDVLQVSPTPTRHIAVQRGSRIYKVNVFDADMQPLSHDAIEAQLRTIMAESSAVDAARGPAIGVLTTEERNSWAATRAHMETSSANAAALADVDNAMFVLTLEDEAPETEEALSRMMLHGDGRNRWFDKCFNLVVCANGKAGIAWEHAWGDGVAVLNFVNTVHEEVVANPVRSAVGPAPEGSVEQVTFKVDGKTGAAVKAAEDRLSQQIDECQLVMYKTDALNKSDIKKSGLSPDGVMQMALQLAHWRTHGYTPSTYESASTAGFKHGRTETIRSATMESAAFCKAFDDKDATMEAKHAALKAATERHNATTRQCMMGKGVDRHLFALEDQAKRSGIPVPDVFTDEGMAVMRDIRVSTSTLSSPALAGGGFGPVSRTNYGVGYGTADEGCGFHIMSYGLDTMGMAKNAEGALRDMQEVMQFGAPGAAAAKKE